MARLFVIVISLLLFASPAAAGKSASTAVKDLYFGEALYYGVSRGVVRCHCPARHRADLVPWAR